MGRDVIEYSGGMLPDRRGDDFSSGGMTVGNQILQVGTRLPSPLHRKIKTSAEAADRSLNAEIVARLDRSFLMDDVAAFLRLEMLRARSHRYDAVIAIDVDEFDADAVFEAVTKLIHDMGEIGLVSMRMIPTVHDHQGE